MARRAEAARCERARARLSHARVDGVDWYWPAGERLPRSAPPSAVRLLAPFDPVVWDRRRFELLWGWAYRFEAYTPAPKRQLGYYALPLLWRDRVIGWGNVSVADGALQCDLGFVAVASARCGVQPRARRRARPHARVPGLEMAMGATGISGDRTIDVRWKSMPATIVTSIAAVRELRRLSQLENRMPYPESFIGPMREELTRLGVQGAAHG